MHFIGEHAENVWYGDLTGNVLNGDILSHADKMVILNFGLQYHDARKEKFNVSVILWSTGTGLIVLTNVIDFNNITIPRAYKVYKWSASTKIKTAMMSCLFTVIHAWLWVGRNILRAPIQAYPSVGSTNKMPQLIQSAGVSFCSVYKNEMIYKLR